MKVTFSKTISRAIIAIFNMTVNDNGILVHMDDGTVVLDPFGELVHIDNFAGYMKSDVTGKPMPLNSNLHTTMMIADLSLKTNEVIKNAGSEL